MHYLITDLELEQLKNGKIEIKDLIKPENEALITWSGEDLKQICKQHKKKFNSDLIYDIKHNLENCDCDFCVKCAFDEVKK